MIQAPMVKLYFKPILILWHRKVFNIGGGGGGRANLGIDRIMGVMMDGEGGTRHFKIIAPPPPIPLLLRLCLYVFILYAACVLF